MAAESLIGGEEVAETLDERILGVINDVLGDTQEDSITTTDVGGATVVTGLGANHETQGVLVPIDSPVTGTITDGDFVVDVDISNNIGLSFDGINSLVDNSAVSAYLTNAVDAALPNPDANEAALRDSLVKGLGLVAPGDDSVVRVINILDNNAEGDGSEVKLSGSVDTEEVIGVNLNKLQDGNVLVLENMDKVVLAGTGTVRVDGSTAAAIAGDNRDQFIIGGEGNDTLVGGGGNDTLSGGAGDNVFGVSGPGNLVITDFKDTDKLAFSLPGISTFEELTAAIDGFNQVGDDTVANFTDGSTITLVGFNADGVTADLLLFVV